MSPEARRRGAARRIGRPRKDRLIQTRVARDLEAEQPVAALTELFEVAKFSEHSVDESMRRRAIDALTAVRAEVRAEAT